jgi:hypothetical protein
VTGEQRFALEDVISDDLVEEYARFAHRGMVGPAPVRLHS